jgi:pantoate--beta-alanine ligase
MRSAIAEIESGVDLGDALAQLARALLAAGFLSVDYAELRDAADLSLLPARSDQPMRLLVAARIGKARLIDNMAVAPA